MPLAKLQPASLLQAYALGAFPMADRDGVVRFYTADPRGVIPLSPPEAFHVPGTLRQTIRQGKFEIRVNHDFGTTMRACMEARSGRTWINEQLIAAYQGLHEIGHAHSVEAWHAGKLGGGLYGVSLGAAFFGESMFHRVTDASKVSLVYLVERLRDRGFELLDTQDTTPHLRRFGCIGISGSDYLRRLEAALDKPRTFA